MPSALATPKRYRNAFVIAAAFALVALLAGGALLRASLNRSSFDPEYQGKRLSRWADDLSFPAEYPRDDTRPAEVRKKHEAAVNAIHQLGTKALSLALKLCAVENSTWKYKLMCWGVDFNEKQNVLPINYQMPYADKKWEIGLGIFRALGSNAAPAIPTLIEFLQRGDSAAANNASLAFRYVGPLAVPSLLVVLTNGNENAMRLAGYSLSYLESNSIAAVPILLEYLKKENKELRKMAAFSLSKITGSERKQSFGSLPPLTNSASQSTKTGN
jgi:hypothetical protein